MKEYCLLVWVTGCLPVFLQVEVLEVSMMAMMSMTMMTTIMMSSAIDALSVIVVLSTVTVSIFYNSQFTNAKPETSVQLSHFTRFVSVLFRGVVVGCVTCN